MIIEGRNLTTGTRIRCLRSDNLVIGDFDQINPPEYAPRLYQTQAGWRVFYTNMARCKTNEALLHLLRVGCDPRYVIYVSIHGFETRISPKKQVKEPWCVTRLHAQTGSIHSDWIKFIDAHDSLTRAHGIGELC